jgi:hypothetical protein
MGFLSGGGYIIWFFLAPPQACCCANIGRLLTENRVMVYAQTIQ